MDNEKNQQGSCLCGAVQVMADVTTGNMGVCHCSICRKWGGGPLFATDCGGGVEFSGEENIGVYSSSEWAERGFCKSCGTHLFYRLKQGAHYVIPVGLFDAGVEWRFSEQIFIDEKPRYYRFADKTRELTGEAVFAEYAQNGCD
ncbi:GFA family protein [Neptuniibacter halophilus]|uniref:GFA family protein n=1 Tax=Neptuniibacter halophilus TaxID=651666 RepID=UPI00257226D1|nr:GFA family protein [Neptuniibacter halophilus]